MSAANTAIKDGWTALCNVCFKVHNMAHAAHIFEAVYVFGADGKVLWEYGRSGSAASTAIAVGPDALAKFCFPELPSAAASAALVLLLAGTRVQLRAVAVP